MSLQLCIDYHPGVMTERIRVLLSTLVMVVIAVPSIAQSTNRMWIDLPAQRASVTVPFVIAGWALDIGASTGSGVDAVDVWAYL